MAEPAIAQIAPNPGGQEAAIAGSQAVIFTATDRKVIEEHGGKVDKNRSFLDVLKGRPLTPEVENEETNVRPQMNLREFQGRVKEHQRLLKHSALYNPREKVEITNELPDNYQESPTPADLPQATVTSASEAAPETKPAAKTEDHNQIETYDEMNQEQTDLHAVKSRAKQYHLLRLLTDSEQEFKDLSEKIKVESLAAVKPAGRQWLEEQLAKITLAAAQYKLNLLNSLEEMQLDDQHKRAIKWLNKVIKELAAA